MAELEPAQIKRLVASTLSKPAFDADSIDRDIHEQRRRDHVAELATHRILLQQRQTVALERIADHLAGTATHAGLVDALYDIGQRR